MQRELPLLGRIDAPATVPASIVAECSTWREAVRRSWSLRRVHYMSLMQLASEAELYRQHVSDYLAPDDKPSRRDLPADAIARFEAVVGNTLPSQWLAMQSRLTVLEQMQADQALIRKAA